MDPASPSPVCFHCGSLIRNGEPLSVRIAGVAQPVCCAGCQAAATLILAQGLERFYEFRQPPTARPATAERNWSIFDRAAALRRYSHELASGERELTLQIEGLHCAACAWLIENSLQRERGVTEIHVNAASGRAQLRFDPRASCLSRLLQHIDALGFAPRPLSFSAGPPPDTAERRAALLRLGVAGFGMMQLMTFAVSLYAGVIQGMAEDLQQFLRFVSLAVATPVVLYSARPFFVSAWRSTRAGRPGMDVPVALSIGAAWLWSTWATLRGRGTVYFDSVVMFTFFLLLGRYVEMSLRHRSVVQQDALVRLLPESVLRLGPRAERVTPDELEANDCVRILPGERVPADGVIGSGSTEVDESLLTGESAPRARGPGDTLLAGTLNVSGTVEMRVLRVGPDSTLAAVARLLERAHAARPRIADFADRVASGFVMGVLLLATLVGLYWLQVDAARAFPTVLAVLVVTCPCALSLATPAALAAATTRLAHTGLLVARSRSLERLAHADRIVFDKTGTLTLGTPRLDEVVLLDARAARERCVAIAAALESHTAHPLARAFAHLNAAAGVTGTRSAAGRGIEGWIDGAHYRLGRLDYVLEGGTGAPVPAALRADPELARIVLADADGPLAAFRVNDAVRADARTTLAQLTRLGLIPLIASGDQPGAVALAAQRLGGIGARAGLRAGEKLAWVQQLQQAGHRVVMVGDGVNDAPVLAAADVSVAIASGADLAKVNADLVLLGAGLGALAGAVHTSRRTLRIIRQNLGWAVLYNLTAVPLAASGHLEPWMAALGMSGSSLLVVLNAMRLLKRNTARVEPGGVARLEAAPAEAAR
ncbi:MAG TPA: heavy metal translocating P-type ATPase [Steroidobacteraceae bacterium]|nr:heavy metal translocating P-type ATPase [Steroidobacteraceae bacterium]